MLSQNCWYPSLWKKNNNCNNKYKLNENQPVKIRHCFSIAVQQNKWSTPEKVATKMLENVIVVQYFVLKLLFNVTTVNKIGPIIIIYFFANVMPIIGVGVCVLQQVLSLLQGRHLFSLPSETPRGDAGFLQLPHIKAARRPVQQHRSCLRNVTGRLLAPTGICKGGHNVRNYQRRSLESSETWIQ